MQLETRILYSFHPELHERLRRATGAPARRGPLYARFVRVGVGDRSGDHGVPATTAGPPRRGLCAVGWDGVGGSAGAEPPGSGSMHVTTFEQPASVGTARAIPWYLWCAALAVTSAYIGGYWDISWHRSIGRDSFWTPAHLAIYACGVLAGLAAAYLIFTTTFGDDRELRRVSVRVWGL